MNGFLEKMQQSKRFSGADLVGGVPISKAFSDWAKANKVRTPSEVEVAYAILALSDLRPTPEGKRVLVSLHKKFEKAFDASP